MLYEQFRPKTFEEVLGQDKAVKTIRGLLSRQWGGRAFWISGPSGAGKTTLARIIAAQGADDLFVTDYDCADTLGVADLDDLDRSLQMHSWGKGGRAVIVNEAHALRAPVIRRLLGLLERIPNHVVWIFTTTKDGQEKLFEDQMDCSPLLSRCIVVQLTNQGLAKTFAEHVQKIAIAQGLDGKPMSAYVRLANDCHSNCRAMIQAVESGAMLA
jgi:replication-associated recombination protein RarA